jgi:L-alanine-DL-glutamate epimerase-like enolase superfamily enzyme
MSTIARVDVLTAQLPFRFAFGHALAERRSSENVYVKVTLDSGHVGFGEGVPRDYVTGETVDGAVAVLCDRYAPMLLGRRLERPEDVPALLESLERDTLLATGREPDPAAWCALELAVLDAAGHAFGCSASRWLAPTQARVVHYDAVIPFSSPRRLAAIAVLVRALGFRQVKVKVGNDLDADLRALALLRRVLGAGIDLRVDANCAWSADEALAAIARMRPYRLSAVEQPLPADDLEGLRRVTAATTEQIIVDESLRTLAEAETLAQTRACDAFNIRVSKCGGLLRSAHIARIAADHGLTCVVGAQVGESGILSAAGRHLAASLPTVRYLEGSAGRLLLKEDLTAENVLPGWGGRAHPFAGPGLGVRVQESVLRKYGRVARAVAATPAGMGVAP